MRLRVAFDASSKFNGPNVNDCLYKGPSLNQLLHEVLLHFRSCQIAIMADISKAFLQISVAPEDHDYMRFLWFAFADCPTIERNIFAHVVFGINSLPFLLAVTLHIHLNIYNVFHRIFKGESELLKSVLAS